MELLAYKNFVPFFGPPCKSVVSHKWVVRRRWFSIF